MSKSKLKPVRVLLVDDHEIVRVGLRTVLSQEGSVLVVGESGTVSGAVQKTEQLKPDVVLMDVRLPDGSGVDACRDILASIPTTRVIVLTSYAEPWISTVLSGMSGFMTTLAVQAGLWLRSLRSDSAAARS